MDTWRQIKKHRLSVLSLSEKDLWQRGRTREKFTVSNGERWEKIKHFQERRVSKNREVMC